jgi:rare lipoprotein A
MPSRVTCAVALVLTLGGCAEIKLGATGVKSVQRADTNQPAQGAYKVGDAYQINGVWYQPAEDYGYNETGIASFYGGERSGVNFHGRRTANGEVYDMTTLTAAHQTLPMPSLVRVTNLENGRQITLRVNDRGPFVPGRIIDVSRRGAQLLGFEAQGTARVRVEMMAEESRQLKAALLGRSVEMAAAVPRTVVASDALPPPSGARHGGTVQNAPLPPPSALLPPTAASGAQPPSRSDVGLARPAPPVVASEAPAARTTATSSPAQPAPAQPGFRQTSAQVTSLWVQAGAFANYDNAQRLGARLQRHGKTQITQIQSGGQQFYRLRVGPLDSVATADRILRDVSAVVPEARIVVE